MKRIVFFLTIMGLAALAMAQAPEKFSYQAVVRDAAGNLVCNGQVGVRVSILKNSASGVAVYCETHQLTTNANGLLSMEIGGGNVVGGVFASIDWGNGPYFVKTETDVTGGSNYTLVATQQLLSVPYALYAKYAGNGGGGGLASDSAILARLHRLELPSVSTLSPYFDFYDGVTFIQVVVNSSGVGPLSTVGVCWSLSPNPTMSDNHMEYTQADYGGHYMLPDAEFDVPGLIPGSTYYARSYASNDAGFVYGNEISFTVPLNNPVSLLTIPQGWVLSSATCAPYFMLPDGSYITNLMNGYLQPYEWDDVLVFSADATQRVRPGLLIPAPGQAGYTTETILGSWYFADSYSTLHMQIPFFYDSGNPNTCDALVETCSVLELTTTMLRIAYTFSTGDGTYTFVLTYVPAQ